MADIKLNSSNALGIIGKELEASKAAAESLKIRKDLYGDDHVFLAPDYNNLAVV